jgi:hypothetical protein
MDATSDQPSPHMPAARHSAFFWNTGEPSVFAHLESSAKLKAIATARIEKRRAEGDDTLNLKGVSQRSDEILRNRRTLTIEGREAGQAATEKRRRAVKASI